MRGYLWPTIVAALAWGVAAQTDSNSAVTSTSKHSTSTAHTTSTIPTSSSKTSKSSALTIGVSATSTGKSSKTKKQQSSATTTSSDLPTGSTPPDVLLNVPTLSVGKIELDVDDLKANINLNAQVAGLVSINAGVAVSVQKVNITIADVDANLELIVRLGHLVDIVNRTFTSLDLNPLLISTLNDVTSLVDAVVGEVDGLLGSITQGGGTVSFLIDNLGNIVSQAAGAAGNTVSSIVGDFTKNMTLTGDVKQLGNGFVQKSYSYSPLNALVNIVFNSAGQVVQAVVDKSKNGNGSGSSTSSGASGSASATSAASASSAASSVSASTSSA